MFLDLLLCCFFMFDVLHVTSFDLGGVSGKGLGGMGENESM